MNSSINRRDFLKSLIPRLASSQPPVPNIPENPFPGQLYWNFKIEQFEPVFSVNKDGDPLRFAQQNDSFASIFDPPPGRRYQWNFQCHRWLIPLGLETVIMRSVLGKELVKECFDLQLRLPEFEIWKQRLNNILPDFDLTGAAFMGLNKEGGPYPEDILTIGYINLSEPVMESHLRLFNTKFPQTPTRYGLKIFLRTGEKKIKAVYHVPHLIAEPPRNLPDHFLWGMAHTFNQNQEEDPIRDVLFSARDKDIRTFCEQNQLEFPENILCENQKVFGFAATYEKATGKVIRIKRYYVFWLT